MARRLWRTAPPSATDDAAASLLVGALRRTEQTAAPPATPLDILRRMQASRLAAASPPTPPPQREPRAPPAAAASAPWSLNPAAALAPAAPVRASTPPLQRLAAASPSYLRSPSQQQQQQPQRAGSPPRVSFSASLPPPPPPPLPARQPAYHPAASSVAADVAAVRGSMRNTPTGRLHNLGAQGRGSIAALLAQLSGKSQQAARELSADVAALRQREELITARLVAGGSGSAQPPPLVLLEVQAELADRAARLQAVAGPAVGAALLRLLAHPEGEAAMRASIGAAQQLPQAAAEGSGGSVLSAAHSLRAVAQPRAFSSRVVPNSRAAASVAHAREQRGVVAHVVGAMPQVGWGAVVAEGSGGGAGARLGAGAGSAGGGWLPSPKLVPHVSRTRFAPPLPPPPATSLSLDGILPDGSRDLWGIVSRARSAAITGEHLAGGLASTRHAVFAGNPENVNYYARAVARHGVTPSGETSICGVWDQVCPPAAGAGAGAGAAGAAEAGAPRGSPPPPQQQQRRGAPFFPDFAARSAARARSHSPARAVAAAVAAAAAAAQRSASPHHQWVHSLRGSGYSPPVPAAAGSPLHSGSSSGAAAPHSAAAAPRRGELMLGDFGALAALQHAKVGSGGSAAPASQQGARGAAKEELEDWFQDAQRLQDLLSK